jgi:cysteine synthase A
VKPINQNIGNTPLEAVKTPVFDLEIWAKKEANNRTGSIKDRFAEYVVSKLIARGDVKKGDTLVESSSGNFGIALAAQAKLKGIKFICVIDPNICPQNETLLELYGAKVIRVTERDKNGGYLLTRLKKVQEIEAAGAYWVNQYSSEYAADSYASMVDEILETLPRIDYFFVAVGTGGTLAGISKALRSKSPVTKIIAVDVEGSVVFSDIPKKRYVPGMGSSLKSEQITEDDYDEIVILPEIAGVNACHAVLEKQAIMLGGSSGTLVAAVDRYFSKKMPNKDDVIVSVFPDGGGRYLDTIYNQSWVSNNFKGVKDDLSKQS